MTDQTLFWYDLETTGRDPARDRILQFAGLRTDLDLNPVDEPINLLCRPPADALPDPEAIALTGISIDQCAAEGLCEFNFANRILDAVSQPGSCVVGFNSLRFDDEFLRHLFYRNLHDPYAREWQNGCSRWDIIDTVRLTRALRPSGIVWPEQDGKPVNRLEQLTAVNGLAHDAAHDALSDVTATIAVANLIKVQQPKLYQYAFTHRDKHSVKQLLNTYAPKPLLHISGMYGGDRAYTATVLPIAEHPTNKNGVLVADLSHNAEPFLNLSYSALQTRWFGNKETLGNTQRLPVKTIHANRCPVVAPLSVLRDEDAKRLHIDRDTARANAASWQDPQLCRMLTDILSEPHSDAVQDPDMQLYSGGFFSQRDRQAMRDLTRMTPGQLANFDASQCDDARLPTLLFRLRARNWPETLTATERETWQHWCHTAVQDEKLRCITASRFRATLARVRLEQPQFNPLMQQLERWYTGLLNSN